MCSELARLAQDLTHPDVPTDLTVKAQVALQESRRRRPYKTAAVVLSFAAFAATFHPGEKIDRGLGQAKHEAYELAGL